jgi:hypothetical protein
MTVVTSEARRGRFVLAPATRSLLVHPVTLACMAVLLVNDHLLKAMWPGSMTGKLSDFAGLVFFPVLLVGVAELTTSRLGRRPPRTPRSMLVCCGLTALVFAPAELWEPATVFYEAALGAIQWPFRILVAVAGGGEAPALRRVSATADPTDLIALPMLLVPVLLAFRTTSRARLEAGLQTGCSQTP